MGKWLSCDQKKESDSGNGSPRRWGWGIPLKKTIRHPNRPEFCQKVSHLSTGKRQKKQSAAKGP
jgi:hypothetical protein